MTLDEIADRIIDWAVNDPRVRALWIEGDAMPELRLERGRAYALVVWAGAKPAT